MIYHDFMLFILASKTVYKVVFSGIILPEILNFVAVGLGCLLMGNIKFVIITLELSHLLVAHYYLGSDLSFFGCKLAL